MYIDNYYRQAILMYYSSVTLSCNAMQNTHNIIVDCEKIGH